LGRSLAEIRAGTDFVAGSLSWVLIIGYVLTNSVYALTFGAYLGNVIGAGPWFPRVAAIAILAVFMGLNLRGVAEAGGVEVVLVWFKLAVLVVLAGWGLAVWDPAMLSRGVPGTGVGAALFGGASVFMAYEGFQLVTYDFDDIENPQKTLPRAVLSAIVVVSIGATFSTGSAINATLFATARLTYEVAKDGELPAACTIEIGRVCPIAP
jgi:amino acid transporter